MAFMEWSEEYLLGIPDVDEQHQRLFALVSRLYENVVSGEAQSAAGTILDELIEYTVEHFATEEKRFLAEGYPLYDEHKQEHDRLTRQALEIQEKFRANQITVTFDLLDFLSDWLKTHTTDSDLKYAQFARQRAGETL
jgi:hemerythrin